MTLRPADAVVAIISPALGRLVKALTDIKADPWSATTIADAALAEVSQLLLAAVAEAEPEPRINWGCRMCASSAAGGPCSCAPLGITRSYRELYDDLTSARERIKELEMVVDAWRMYPADGCTITTAEQALTRSLTSAREAIRLADAMLLTDEHKQPCECGWHRHPAVQKALGGKA